MRGVWKSTTMVFGALCVMIIGTSLMPTLCADSLVTVVPQLHVVQLTLVVAVVQSTMIMLDVLDVRHAWLTAPIEVLELTIAVIMKMQEWCVEPLLHKVSAEFVS